MKLKDIEKIPDVLKLFILFAIPVAFLTFGAFYNGEDVPKTLGVVFSFFCFIAFYIGGASFLQKFVFDRLDIVLRGFAKSNGLNFVYHGYPVFANPGIGSTVNGNLKGLTISLKGNFHGYQVGRKSFVITIDGITSPTKMLFSNNKHKFPKLDFWNSGKIPSFSSFLCERGPIVRLKNAYVMDLPQKIKDSHYLVAEKKQYADELIEKKVFNNLTQLTGAFYLDGEKLYYGQANLPHSVEEINLIVTPLTQFVKYINQK
jgi:hypothetical protein